MSRHLPVVSGRQLIRILKRLGFVVLRQKGSHVALERRDGSDCWRTVVPLHRELRTGTLSDILEQSGLTADDLRDLL